MPRSPSAAMLGGAYLPGDLFYEVSLIPRKDNSPIS